MNNNFYKPRSYYNKIFRPSNESKIKQPNNDLSNFPELVKQPNEQSNEQSNEQPTKQSNSTKLWSDIVKMESTVQHVQVKQLPNPPKRKNKIKKNIVIDSDDDNIDDNDDNSDDNDEVIKRIKPKKEKNKVDENGWNIVMNGIKKEDNETIINDNNIKHKKQEKKNKIINDLVKNIVKN